MTRHRKEGFSLYCVIDIGSNTVRLVIYRIEGGSIRPILNKKYTVGLAGYVDAANCLTTEGIDRLVTVLKEYRDILSLLPDCRLYPFATASLRNVVNTEYVLETIARETGLQIQALSGYEEAMLDYRGAIRHTSETEDGLLVDIGGGSAELVFFRAKTVLAAHSVPLGSLNLYSRFVEGILPKKKELAAMRREVRQMLKASLPPADGYIAEPLCSVGGTARAALALYQNTRKGKEDGRPAYDAAFLEKVLTQAEEDPKKLMHRILKIAPDRVHTLVPGLVILSCVAELYGSRTVLTSPYGVREGYLSFMLEKEGIHID